MDSNLSGQPSEPDGMQFPDVLHGSPSVSRWRGALARIRAQLRLELAFHILHSSGAAQNSLLLAWFLSCPCDWFQGYSSIFQGLLMIEALRALAGGVMPSGG